MSGSQDCQRNFQNDALSTLLKNISLLEGAGAALNVLFNLAIIMTLVGYVLLFGGRDTVVVSAGLDMVFFGSLGGLTVFVVALIRL